MVLFINPRMPLVVFFNAGKFKVTIGGLATYLSLVDLEGLLGEKVDPTTMAGTWMMWGKTAVVLPVRQWGEVQEKSGSAMEIARPPPSG